MKSLILAIAIAVPSLVKAGVEDTISIRFGENSRIIIYVSDKNDLQLLQQYDINKMLRDLQMSLDSVDENTRRLTIRDSTGVQYLKDTTAITEQFRFVPEGYQKEIQTSAFSTLDIGFNFEALVKKADSYKVILDGKMEDVEATQVIQSGEDLKIAYPDGQNHGKVKVYIEAPELKSLDISGVARVNAIGFDAPQFRIRISGAGKGQAVILAGETIVNASGASWMKLIGQTEKFVAEASGAAEIDASEFKAGSAMVKVSGAGKAYINADEKNFSSFGAGKIIEREGMPGSTGSDHESGKRITIRIGKYEFSAPVEGWEHFDEDFGDSPEDLIDKANKDEYIQEETPNVRHSMNFEFGMNNYLEDGSFPDANGSLYSVRPWGSWYVGINSYHKFHIEGPLFLDWGKGISWYNFKFEDNATRLTRLEQGVGFVEDLSVDGIKSKLAVSHLNMSLVPILDFSHGLRKVKSYSVEGFNFTQYNKRGFRIGVGAYAGYRIGSHAKYVVRDDRREKERDKGNFFLNNWRYGIRGQAGFKALDLFFNYDLSPLYVGTMSPDLHPFSFGILF